MQNLIHVTDKQILKKWKYRQSLHINNLLHKYQVNGKLNRHTALQRWLVNSLLQLLVATSPNKNSLNFVSTLTTKAVTAEADTAETERP